MEKIINDIKKMSKNITLISFDIFDTLLSRRVTRPIDIFYAVRAYLLEREEFLLHGEFLYNFPELRLQAELQAREKAVELGASEGEILLDDIYQELYDLSLTKDEYLIRILRDTEILLEKKFIFAPTTAKKVYQEVKKLEKRIIYISDMYLPKDTIKELLISQGYEVKSEDIFISGELGCSKHSGKLYERVENLLQIKKEYWLHIGDNQRADIQQAKRFGIHTYFANWSMVKNIPNPKKLPKNDEFIQSIINFTTTKQGQEFLPTEPFAKMGYQIFGPFLFGFMSWLAYQLQIGKFERALFFARDAQIFQIIYNQYLQDIVPVNERYVYISRASIYNLSYTDWRLEKIWYIFSGRSRKHSVKDILIKLDLNPDDFLQEVKQVGFQGLNDIITSDNNFKAFNLINVLFLPIMQKSEELRKRFSPYFIEKIGKDKKIAIIDIGWAGNIQSSFMRAIIEEWHNLDISGFYVSLYNNENNNSPYYKMKGWLNSPKTIKEIFLRGGVEILEFVFSADHGSTLGYQEENDKLTPILEKQEKENEYRQKAMLTREGILKYFTDNAYLLQTFPLSAFHSDLWAKPFYRLVEDPTLEEAELLGDLTHSDSAGENNQRFYLAKKLSFQDLCSNPDAYYQEYEKSFWKSAFILRNKGSLPNE